MWKKIICAVLVFSFFMATNLYSFAASNVSVGLIEDSNKNASISYLSLKKENIKALIEFYEKQSKNDKIKLNKEKLNELMVALNEYMENTGDKGEETTKTIVPYSEDSEPIILLLPATPPHHGQLMFNRAGWDIIKSILAIGGGATTVGLAIAALCGVAVSPAVATLIGGVLAINYALVELQFALGLEFASLYF